MSRLYSCVFAALDGSEAQVEIAKRAVAFASDNEAKLVLGHVIDSVPYEASGIDFEALCAEGARRVEEDLADVLAEARGRDTIPEVEVMVRAGRVADTLIEQMIEPSNADLVICGERGLSNLQYAFVGSVSKHLIRTAHVDVLVVKMPQK